MYVMGLGYGPELHAGTVRGQEDAFGARGMGNAGIATALEWLSIRRQRSLPTHAIFAAETESAPFAVDSVIIFLLTEIMNGLNATAAAEMENASIAEAQAGNDVVNSPVRLVSGPK